jgi:hypothetical protein
MLPRISLISSPRSGTTHLVHLLEGLDGLHVVKNEWLSRRGVAWASEDELTKFRALHRVDYTDHRDPRLCAWVRENKAETLDVLETMAQPEARAVIYKSFPTDVDADEYDALFYDRPGTVFIILRRRPIDVFISLTKAEAIGKWNSFDTTNVKPNLDADFFSRWHLMTADWFTGLEARLTADGRPYGVLEYDADIMPGIRHTMTRVVQELGAAGFETRVRSGVIRHVQWQRFYRQLRGKGMFGNLGAVKQDKNSDPATRVKNWDAFCAQVLEKFGSLDVFDRYDQPEKRAYWARDGVGADG